MDLQEVLILIDRAKNFYVQGSKGKEKALEIGLQVREILDKEGEQLQKETEDYYHLDGGVNAFIYNCMFLLKRYEGIIPFLEKTLHYLQNDRNPDLWRRLGLLYLDQERDLEKACYAWKKALELAPPYQRTYPGLNIVFVYEELKKKGKEVSWKVEFIDLETGNFSVVLN